MVSQCTAHPNNPITKLVQKYKKENKYSKDEIRTLIHLAMEQVRRNKAGAFRKIDNT